MMNVLDMSGNQIQHFLVHNGNVTGTGTQLTAAAGSFAYNEADRSLYYGYENENSKKLWSRLVDVAHLSQSLSGDDVYKWAKTVSESKVEIDGNTFALGASAVVSLLEQGGNAYSWGDHAIAGYTKVFPVTVVRKTMKEVSDKTKNDKPASGETPVGVATDGTGIYLMCRKGDGSFVYCTKWGANAISGLPSSESIESGGITYLAVLDDYSLMLQSRDYTSYWFLFSDAKNNLSFNYLKKLVEEDLPYNILYDSLDTLNRVYNWGNHADAGYTKVYKIDKAVEADGRPMVGNTYNDLLGLQQNTGKNDWVQHEVVFDTATLSLLCEYTRLEGDDTVSAYVKEWNGFNTINDASFYEVNGNLLFVKGNASVYKYENSQWVLYLSGASQDVIQKIDAIKNALGIGDDYQDPTPDIIDTWNEMKAYFANIDDKDQSLLNLIASKANDADVVKKPSTAVNGEMLVIDNGNPTWKARKIVVSNIDHVGFSGLDWEVDISELETIDVNVTLYMKNATGRYEVILADISVNETQRGSGVRRSVVIEFGADMTDKELKLVITA